MINIHTIVFCYQDKPSADNPQIRSTLEFPASACPPLPPCGCEVVLPKDQYTADWGRVVGHRHGRIIDGRFTYDIFVDIVGGQPEGETRVHHP